MKELVKISLHEFNGLRQEHNQVFAVVSINNGGVEAVLNENQKSIIEGMRNK